MSVSTSYATLAELRAHPSLKLAAGETADDTLLSALLLAVTAMIDKHTGRTFQASADTTRYFDARRDVLSPDPSYRNAYGAGYGGFALTMLTNDDLAQITSITNGDGVALEAGDYVTEPRNILDVDNGNYAPIWAIRFKWSSGKWWTFVDDFENAIAVTGRWAYSVTPPTAVKRACIEGSAALYRMSLSGDNDRPILAGGGVVIEPSRMPAVFYALLAKYVRQV